MANNAEKSEIKLKKLFDSIDSIVNNLKAVENYSEKTADQLFTNEFYTRIENEINDSISKHIEEFSNLYNKKISPKVKEALKNSKDLYVRENILKKVFNFFKSNGESEEKEDDEFKKEIETIYQKLKNLNEIKKEFPKNIFDKSRKNCREIDKLFKKVSNDFTSVYNANKKYEKANEKRLEILIKMNDCFDAIINKAIELSKPYENEKIIKEAIDFCQQYENKPLSEIIKQAIDELRPKYGKIKKEINELCQKYENKDDLSKKYEQ